MLVVDDEPDVRALLRDVLQIAGLPRASRRAACSRAWSWRAQRLPDVITMDLMLPDLDGFEAIRLLREQPETRDTPVVVLSAIEVEPDDPRALGATVLPDQAVQLGRSPQGDPLAAAAANGVGA